MQTQKTYQPSGKKYLLSLLKLSQDVGKENKIISEQFYILFLFRISEHDENPLNPMFR